MDVTLFTPKVTASWTLPLQETRICPISDIHYGDPGCDEDRLRRHIDWALEHDCYFLNLGDNLDIGTPSNRRALKIASVDLYDNVREMLDDAAEVQLEKLMRVLEPTKGRWVGWVSGHHNWEFQDGSTADVRLCQQLDAKYMGDGPGLSILHFKYPRPNRPREAIHGYAKIWFTHGVGAAQTPTGILGRLYNIADSFDAHVYLMGHYHRKLNDMKPRFTIDCTRKGNFHWTTYNRIFACTGGYLKAYEMGRKDPFGRPSAGYVEKRMLTPTSLGGLVVYVRPRILEGRIVMDLGLSTG